MSGGRPAPVAWSIDVSLLGQPSSVGMFFKVVFLSAGAMANYGAPDAQAAAALRQSLRAR